MMMNTQGLPKVRILATGGTIAGTGSSPLQTGGYKAGQLSVDELVQAAPGLEQIARIEGEQVCNVASLAVTNTIWLELARRINAALREPDLAGVVVTHGTDTLEETAYFLHLVVKSRKPVVVVGAMRPATALSPDGPLNLVNAVRVAASPAAVGCGVLVVLNDEIFSARDATKGSTYQLNAFRSPDLGPLGSINNGVISLYHKPTRRHTWETEFCVEQLPTLPRTDIIYSHIEADAVAVDALVAAGSRGIVLAGAGSGHTTQAAHAALGAASTGHGVVIVRSSRVGGGRILPTSDERLEAGAAVGGDNLNPEKARVLLTLALTRTTEPREIQRMFNTY
jgi:L-asparaginase